jgi:hypothetical protein
MFRKMMVLIFGISLLGLNGCNIKTPEIHGIVLDEETKQPVEEAWVRATLEIKSKSIQGDVHSVLSVDPPHTRTDERGRFVIPSKKFKTPPFPIGLGTQVESFDVGAKTVSRIGGIQIPIDDLKKKKVEVRIYIRSDEKIYEEQFQKYLKEGIKEERALELIERDQFSSLQSLYKYCLTGRSSVEIPSVEGGSDEWELNYAIVKHERYLERFRRDAEEGKVRAYGAALEQLSDLYERQGDFEKAIQNLRWKVNLIEKRGLLEFKDWQRDKEGIESKIKELEQKLGQKQGK